MLTLIWILIGLNVFQAGLLIFFVHKTNKLKLKDWSQEILGVDRALHQRVDSMEGLWKVKWEHLRDDVNVVTAKLRRFFSVK